MTRQAYNGARIDSLMAILETKRPHDSKAENKFIGQFITPTGVEFDQMGNAFLHIPGDGDNILWSCHTDTVHRDGGRQAIQKRKDIVTLSPKAKANCLGADDGAGIWLMLEMIAARKPGLYVFHRGEECGGIGSDYIATHTPDRLAGIDAAIALDRKGFNSIITHQGSRGCSDKFSASLAAAMPVMRWESDDSGLFTDTANYFSLVPECTNLSVGYLAQHTARESLDVGFLAMLRHELIALDTTKLVIARDNTATVMDYPAWSKSYIGEKDFSNGTALDDLPDFLIRQHDKSENELACLWEVIERNPQAIADLLDSYGIMPDEICEAVADYTGDSSVILMVSRIMKTG
jgi:hypothetical protein